MDWRSFVARHMGKVVDYELGDVLYKNVKVVGVRRSFSTITDGSDEWHGFALDLRRKGGEGLTTITFPSPFPANRPIPGWEGGSDE